MPPAGTTRPSSNSLAAIRDQPEGSAGLALASATAYVGQNKPDEAIAAYRGSTRAGAEKRAGDLQHRQRPASTGQMGPGGRQVTKRRSEWQPVTSVRLGSTSALCFSRGVATWRPCASFEMSDEHGTNPPLPAAQRIRQTRPLAESRT